MTMYKDFHPRDDVNRLYMLRKKGERWLGSIEDSVDALIQRLEDYLKMYGGILINVIWNNTDNMMEKQNGSNQKKIRIPTLWMF